MLRFPGRTDLGLAMLSSTIKYSIGGVFRKWERSTSDGSACLAVRYAAVPSRLWAGDERYVASVGHVFGHDLDRGLEGPAVVLGDGEIDGARGHR